MKYKNYFIVTILAITSYLFTGFNFIHYLLLVIVYALLSAFAVAFGHGEKIPYAVMKEGETDIHNATPVQTSAIKYLLIRLPILVLLSLLPFALMYGLNHSMDGNYFKENILDLNIVGLLINIIPFLLSIFVFKDVKKWLTNLSNKYLFILAMAAFIGILIPTELLKLITLSILFVYATQEEQGSGTLKVTVKDD